jgi:hypothetical protein
MKKLRSVDYCYTLYEDDDGSFVLDLVIPSTRNAWATYEKRVVLSAYDKILIRAFPTRVDAIANKLIAEEKKRQKNTD